MILGENFQVNLHYLKDMAYLILLVYDNTKMLEILNVAPKP